jgi:hypothetical protein
MGATWHPDHFLCAYCGKPIREPSFNVQDGRAYHPTCFREQVLPRCAYCDKPLVGEYLRDYWGNGFHREHEQQYPHCAYCGRLVPPQQQELGYQRRAGTIRCPVCRSTAVETREEAQPLFRQAIQWTGQQGLRYNNLSLQLEIVDRAKLDRYLNESGVTEPHSLGITMSETHIINGRITSTHVNGVAVLTGLPELLFRGVVIHELGHVWLVVQEVQRLPSWQEEGFCELLSYRFYSEMHTREAQYRAENIERNPNAVYGGGFRRMHEYVNKRGFPALLYELQQTKRLSFR